MKKAFFLVITGPTGVGKTDFVLELAQHIPSEIINADMGQCYKPLTIGTSKPDWKNQATPHHLFDILDQPEHFSVTDYREKVLELMHGIWSRNKLPIIVGGSGFYIKSLFFPPPHSTAPGEFEGSESDLWDQLNAIDPERACSIHKNDSYRLKRALAIWQQTGAKPSSMVQEFYLPSRFSCIFISRDKDDLYQKIDKRVIQMIKNGWVNEVKKLQSTDWENFLKLKKIIGYELLLDHLRDPSLYPLDHTISDIQQRTRNYAKRQMTFLRMLKRKLNQVKVSQADINMINMRAINLTHDDYEDAISSVISTLK